MHSWKNNRTRQHTLFCNNCPATLKLVPWYFWISQKVNQYENREYVSVSEMTVYITQLQATNLASNISHPVPLWLSPQGKERPLKRAAQTTWVKLLGIHELAFFFQSNLNTMLKGISLRPQVQQGFSSKFPQCSLKAYRSMKCSILGQFPVWVAKSSL